jgi:hypothetical protein
MPLLKGKENIGHNVTTEENAGKPKAQAVAIALKTAGVAKAGDARLPQADSDGGYSVGDCWNGRTA